MSDPPTPPLPLEDGAWLRRLARALVRDPNEAEEAVQDTWLAALRRPLDAQPIGRGWLAAVLRNALRQRARRERSRTHHERASSLERDGTTDSHPCRDSGAARSDPLDSASTRPAFAHSTDERLELHERLLTALRDLPAVQRDVLVARYFDGRPPREIARMDGVPLATVKSRLHRGLATLRARLDERTAGGRSNWCLAMAAWAGVRPARARIGLGAIWMSSKTMLASLVVVATLGGVWLATRERSALADGVQGPAITAVESRDEPEPLALAPNETRSRPEPTRVESDGAGSAAGAPTQASSPTRRIRGRVLDLRGRAIVGARVVTDPRHALLALGAPPAPPPAPPESTAPIPHATADAGDTAAVDAARPLAGSLAGSPPGAVQPSLLVPGVHAVSLATEADPLGTRSDEQGRFELATSATRLSLELDDPNWITVYRASVRPDRFEAEHLIIAAEPIVFAGVVLDPAGRPLADVALSLRYRYDPLVDFPFPFDGTNRREFSATSETDGGFRFDRLPAVEGAEITLAKAGYREVAIELPRQSRSDARLTLVPLADAPVVARLRGSVRAANGDWLAGATLRLGRERCLTDERGFFELELRELPDEGIELIASHPGHLPCRRSDVARGLAGGETPPPLELVLDAPLSIRGRLLGEDDRPIDGWRVRLVDPDFVVFDGDEDTCAVDVLARGEARAFSTDAGGRFELDGLSPRDYVLRLWHPGTFESFDSAPIAAGSTDVVLRRPADGLLPTLRGRVVSRTGAGHPGVLVYSCFQLEQDAFGFVFDRVNEATTDAAGWFEMRDVPRRNLFFVAEGEAIARATLFIEGDVPSKGLSIEANSRYHLRFVQERGGSPATSFRVEDAGGESVGITTQGASGSTERRRQPLVDGRSHVVIVDERARTLVVYRDENELARLDLNLLPGRVNEVRW